MAWRALATFTLLAILGAVLYLTSDPFNLICDGAGACPELDFVDTLRFSVESMVGFLRPPGNALEGGEPWLQLAQRVAGPVLLAFAALALRTRIKR